MSRPSLASISPTPRTQTDWMTVWMASLFPPFLRFQKRGNNSFQSAPAGRMNGRTRNPVFPTLRKIRVTGGASLRAGDGRRPRRLNIQIFSINLRIFEVEATFSFTFDRPSAAKISTVHHPRNNNNFIPKSRSHFRILHHIF